MYTNGRDLRTPFTVHVQWFQIESFEAKYERGKTGFFKETVKRPSVELDGMANFNRPLLKLNADRRHYNLFLRFHHSSM